VAGGPRRRRSRPLQDVRRDPAEILQQLYMSGFELRTFEQFPRAVGVVRGECIALLVPSDAGLQILGSPGWQIGEAMGVLTTVDGRRVFQHKTQTLEATPERLNELRQFEADLRAGMAPSPTKLEPPWAGTEFQRRGAQ
jgi:hypothetical protein